MKPILLLLTVPWMPPVANNGTTTTKFVQMPVVGGVSIMLDFPVGRNGAN
jgi:hypothetical protein